MELQLEAFEYFLINEANAQLISDKLFGILLLENGELLKEFILEENFNKYVHIFLTDDYPNASDIKSKIPEDASGFPIVTLK
jgi:hypothetical protein